MLSVRGFQGQAHHAASFDKFLSSSTNRLARTARALGGTALSIHHDDLTIEVPEVSKNEMTAFAASCLMPLMELPYIPVENFVSSEELKELQNLAAQSLLSGLTKPGRQGTGYSTYDIKSDLKPGNLYDELRIRAMTLLGKPVENYWDMHFIHYPQGSSIPVHKDQAGILGTRHRRLNIIVNNPKRGGIFVAQCIPVPMDPGEGVLFYPDEVDHSVSTLHEGSRVVFSVGAWL